MKRLGWLAKCLMPMLVACRAPVSPSSSSPDAYYHAVQAELIGDTDRAIDAALAAIGDDTKEGAVVTQAALELLTHRTTAPLGPLEDISLAARTSRSLFDPLAALHAKSAGDKRMYLALALLQVASAPRGQGAASVRSYIRCMDRVSMRGPVFLDSGRQAGVSDLDEHFAPGEGMSVADRGCDLSLGFTSARPGLRIVNGLYQVPHAGKLRVAWTSTNATELRLNGRVASLRKYAAGPGAVLNVVNVNVTSLGAIDVELRAWMGTATDKVSLFAFFDDAPLVAEDPTSGVKLASLGDIDSPSPCAAGRPCVDRMVAANAMAYRGDGRAVQKLLAEQVLTRVPEPVGALAYVRALRRSRDLPKAEMLRIGSEIVESIRKQEPRSWEAAATLTAIEADTKGGAEGCRAGLAMGREGLTRDGLALTSLVDSSCWLTLGQPGKARKAMDAFPSSTSAYRVADAQSFPRTATEQSAKVCAARGNEACANVERDAGRFAIAKAALENERTRKGAAKAFAPQVAELQCLLKQNVTNDDLLAGDKSVALAACLGRADASSSMPDVPRNLVSLFMTEGRFPFDGLAEKTFAKVGQAKGDATVVLEHVEQYSLNNGMLVFQLFDLRRLGGTTDVEQNAQAEVPSVDGQVSHRTIRRRIFKRDGRVIEPNRTPDAAQAGADLVQLEAGDSVESIVLGIAVPDARGYVAFDTPDLLTERTRVAHASVQVTGPKSLRLRAHPLLFKVRDAETGNGLRETLYEVSDLGPRNIEWRGLQLDRPVSVLASNDTWKGVGARLASALVALEDDDDPEIAQMIVRAASMAPQGKLDEVRSIVKYVGDRIRVASPWLLADAGFVRTEGTYQQSARSMLLAREGSRTWVIHRALRELGIQSEVVVVEPESVTEDKDPIVHPGRFTHPLLRATIEGQTFFIDADVSGAPLPVGQVSPELVGRPMLHASGLIDTLARDLVKIDQDEVHLKLRLESNGDASGDVVIQIGGPAAQELDESLLRLVGEQRAYLLRSLVHAWVPGADLQKVDATREGDRIVVRASVTVPRYAEREGTSQRLRLPGLVPLHRAQPVSSSTLSRTYGARSDRTSALMIRDAVQYKAVREIALPAGFSIDKKVDNVQVAEASIAATRKITHTGAVVTDAFTFELRPTMVTPAQFGSFLRLARRIDEGFLATEAITTKLEARAPTQVR